MDYIGSRKSLDTYREIWINLANNQRYSRYIDERDIKTFHRRLENEGIHFLTSVLPLFGKALDSSFSVGFNGKYEAPAGFSCSADGIPHFLGMATRWALDGDSIAVDCVRQLSYIFYKLEVDFDQNVVKDFLDNFEKVDQDLSAFTEERLLANPLVIAAKDYIRRILCNFDPLDIRPRHGSGATACRTTNYEKWEKLRYYPKLDSVYSYSDYFFYSVTHLVDEYDKLVEAKESVPMARVCLVPKDSRGPRIISCEPAELMYIQQGLMLKLYEILENHNMTKGCINFADQGVNRELAHSSSITGEMATLDLTDASDRVSLNLVRVLFPENWVEALESCRSESTKLPDGRIVKLNKFAPMGSACCFPVEAMVFWAIACACIQSARLKHSCYVYGDDIIVPAGLADIVMEGLESVGLKVNVNKSFKEGNFRESCGGDYHNGYDVTPVRIRKSFHSSSTSLAADTDLANNFIAKFGKELALPIIKLIEDHYAIPFPRTLLDLPCSIRLEPCASNDVFYRRRWNSHLQRFEHRIQRVFARALARRDPDWVELLRKELTRGTEGGVTDKYANSITLQELALEPGYYVDPHATTTTWGWSWLG